MSVRSVSVQPLSVLLVHFSGIFVEVVDVCPALLSVRVESGVVALVELEFLSHRQLHFFDRRLGPALVVELRVGHFAAAAADRALRVDVHLAVILHVHVVCREHKRHDELANETRVAFSSDGSPAS